MCTVVVHSCEVKLFSFDFTNVVINLYLVVLKIQYRFLAPPILMLRVT